jgi:uncharacterized membrane protein YecN with MAPEG domain
MDLPLTALPWTGVLTSVMALMLFTLSLRVLLLRVRLRQPLGDGGHAVLQRAVRVQANFAEHVPLALLLFLLLEWHGLPPAALQAYAALLVLARVVHAVGVSQTQERLAWRVIGTVLTLLLLSGGAVLLLVQLVQQAPP